MLLFNLIKNILSLYEDNIVKICNLLIPRTVNVSISYMGINYLLIFLKDIYTYLLSCHICSVVLFVMLLHYAA